jgi:thiol:disulfide interchange protein
MRVLVVVVSGVMILAFAAVVVTSCDTSPEGSRVIMLCLGLLGAVVRLASLAKGNRAVPTGTEPSPDSARFGPPDPRPQLAGSACAHCEQKIMLQTEAVLCKTCKKPLHRECRKQHKADAHRPISGQAYR